MLRKPLCNIRTAVDCGVLGVLEIANNKENNHLWKAVRSIQLLNKNKPHRGKKRTLKKMNCKRTRNQNKWMKDLPEQSM